MESLNDASHDLRDGQIRGIQSIQSLTVSEPMPPQDPPNCPKKIQIYNNNQFNQEAHDNYARIARQCTDIAESPLSSDVWLECPRMIRKMRGLLHPKHKAEVDYKEAAKDVSNIWWY